MYSSSWAAPSERQGQVGDLKTKSKEELGELLSRQDKLLSNKGYIQTLQDKGKKISDFAEKICLTLAHNEEEERKQDILSFVRTRLQSKYQQALTQRQPGLPTTPMAPRQGLCHPNPMKAYCHHHSLRPGGSVTGSTLMTSLRPGSHYSPAQLLTLEQSADLLLEQTRKHQEFQAKLAAQKLSEDLRFSTGSYVVEGGLLGAYREAHDDGAQLSPDED